MLNEAWFPLWWKAHKMGRHFGRRHGRDWSWQFGPERRMRRGDMKYRILELLAEKPRHGYDVIRDLEDRNEGYRASPGSVYPTLQMLEDGGFVTSESVEGKRVYTITGAGRELLSQRGAGFADEDDSEERAPWAELKRAGVQLGAAVMQIVREHDREKLARVRDILDRARREIYAILADG